MFNDEGLDSQIHEASWSRNSALDVGRDLRAAAAAEQTLNDVEVNFHHIRHLRDEGKLQKIGRISSIRHQAREINSILIIDMLEIQTQGNRHTHTSSNMEHLKQTFDIII